MYQLTPFHRNTPVQDLLDDLARTALHMNQRTLTQADYRKHGKFSPVTFPKRFGDWNSALKKAGLCPSRNFKVPARLVLADIRWVARKLKIATLSGTLYVQHGRFSLVVIYRHFGNWQKAVEYAGLAPALHYRIPDEDLFLNLDQLWTHFNRQPRSHEMLPPLSRFGLTPYQRRFGGFRSALHAFTDWKKTNPQTPSLPITTFSIPHKTSRIVSHRLRYLVLLRDHFKCQACGQSPATDPNVILEVDHKHPWSRGGETVIENLQTLCEQCNGGKSNL